MPYRMLRARKYKMENWICKSLQGGIYGIDLDLAV